VQSQILPLSLHSSPHLLNVKNVNLSGSLIYFGGLDVAGVTFRRLLGAGRTPKVKSASVV
jgi:hypothetical protein